tara:strand:+ start:1331 stop:2422 length:1092 start_codon:yes stop_codon:yes gene_type:complete
LPNITTTIEKKPYILAIAIVLVIVLWMLSGDSKADQKAQQSDEQVQERLPKVQVMPLVAKNINKNLTFYGKSEPDKIANISARQAGQVLEILVEEGQFVKQDQVILRLDKSDLAAQITSAEALVAQYQTEYEGALKLNQQGLQNKVLTMQAQAMLQQAKATLASLELKLERTEVRAAFDGVINKRLVEIGDYVGIGDPILQLADLDPLIVRADATQKEVQGLEVGQATFAHVLNDKTYPGRIRYIASVADDSTNTFRIEAAFENPGMKYKAGFSTQLNIELPTEPAMLLSPAFMALDEQGNIGVKVVNDDNIVEFKSVNLAKSTEQGVWLWGLGEQANVITLGQGFVRAGDKVEPVFTEATSN